MTASPRTDVAVIIVNYNTAALALDAIESVFAHSHGAYSIETHVLDNASPNGDAAILAEKLASPRFKHRVKLYCATENLGFGRGNNYVISSLASSSESPRYVFLLNPDAQLKNEAISLLVDFLDTNPSVAAAGARIEAPDGSPLSAAFRFPGVISIFSSALSFGPIGRLLAQWQVPLSPNIETRRVDWVSGAAVMFRMSSLQRSGYFDPAFFLYFEETDLMHRLNRHGAEVWHVAEARVIHVEGASTSVRSDNARKRRPSYWYHSWQYYHLKNYGRPTALVAAFAWIFGALLNQIICAVRKRQPAAPRNFYHDFWSVALRPLLGLKAIPYE